MKVWLGVLACAVLAVSAQAQPQGQGQPARPSISFDTTAGPVKITPIYHASTLIEAGGKVIYVDPARPAPLAGLPQADLILITDIHGDHMDADAVRTLSKAGTQVIAPAAVAQTITSAKVLNNGQNTTWEQWQIEAIPAYNIVRKRDNGEPFHVQGRGNGYVLTYGGKRFYFSGDTEAVPEMRALRNIDVAFLCMYGVPVMGPEEAAEAALAFKPRMVIPYHYRYYNVAVFMSKVAGSGIEVKLFDWYPRTS